jgi:SAM-dependent methyltransferase
MDRAEFDRFAEEYRAIHDSNLAASGETHEYFADYKMRDLRRLLRSRSAAFERGRFLDFGAGIGTSVAFFRKYFPLADLTCVDVSTRSLSIGRARFADDAKFVAFDGQTLPFADEAFDFVFACCVFHHIASGAHLRLLRELRRVLRTTGGLMVYEHNPLNPLTVRTVSRCPLDENAVLMRAGALRATIAAAGFSEPRVQYRVFFPRALSWLRGAEEHLGWLPLGAQYFVHAAR